MKKIMLALAAAVVLSMGHKAFAYDPDALDYSFGTIKSVSPTAITLEEYDFEGDLEKTVQVTYDVNDKTEFDNFQKIDELKVDEDVEVYFVEENGKKVAVSLAKDEGLEDIGDEQAGDAGEGMGDEEIAPEDAAAGTPAAQ